MMKRFVVSVSVVCAVMIMNTAFGEPAEKSALPTLEHIIESIKHHESRIKNMEISGIEDTEISDGKEPPRITQQPTKQFRRVYDDKGRDRLEVSYISGEWAIENIDTFDTKVLMSSVKMGDEYRVEAQPDIKGFISRPKVLERMNINGGTVAECLEQLIKEDNPIEMAVENDKIVLRFEWEDFGWRIELDRDKNYSPVKKEGFLKGKRVEYVEVSLMDARDNIWVPQKVIYETDWGMPLKTIILIQEVKVNVSELPDSLFVIPTKPDE